MLTIELDFQPDSVVNCKYFDLAHVHKPIIFGRFIPNFFLASSPSLSFTFSFLFIFYLLSPSHPLENFWPQPFKNLKMEQ